MDKEQKGYRKLIAWQKADELAYETYRIVNNFPKKYFALIDQMQRAALSVPANIVEGYSRTSQIEKRRFYQISLSSLTELEYYLDFSLNLNCYDQSLYKKLSNLQISVAKLLTGLIRYIK
jgi:four helix bundle protein